MLKLYLFLIPIIITSIVLILFPYTGLGRLIFMPIFLIFSWAFCIGIFFFIKHQNVQAFFPMIIGCLLLFICALLLLPQVDNRSPMKKLLNGEFPNLESVKIGIVLFPFVGMDRDAKAQLMTSDDVYEKKRSE